MRVNSAADHGEGKPGPKPRVEKFIRDWFILSPCPLGVARVEAR